MVQQRTESYENECFVEISVIVLVHIDYTKASGFSTPVLPFTILQYCREGSLKQQSNPVHDEVFMLVLMGHNRQELFLIHFCIA